MIVKFLLLKAVLFAVLLWYPLKYYAEEPTKELYLSVLVFLISGELLIVTHTA